MLGLALGTMADKLAKILDTNKDGKVSASELSALLNAAGIKLKEAQVQWIINRADKDEDGMLDAEELKQLISAALTISKLVRKPAAQ